jgi:hypothetical protein
MHWHGVVIIFKKIKLPLQGELFILNYLFPRKTGKRTA